MHTAKLAAIAFAFAAVLPAQLTQQQREQDFQSLANLYARRYAPLEWKKQALGFDAMDLRPWLTRIRAAKDDIEYHEIAAEYVASLHDTHTSYRTPGSFVAQLPFVVDIYDGKVLVEGIGRQLLPVSRYPFQVGDELVSIDGKTAEEWISIFSKYRTQGNPDATRRLAADGITFRVQVFYPRAGETPKESDVVIRRASGEVETYKMEWITSNVPFTGPPKLPGMRTTAAEPTPEEFLQSQWNWSAPTDDSVFRGTFIDEEGKEQPRRYLLGYGSRNPTFMIPGLQVRLGRFPGDFHFSGVWTAAGKRLGYLRIPNFAPPSTPAAIQELTAEIAYLEANTDGLVIDVSRNTGGGCYMLDVAQRLIPGEFWFFGEHVRATWDRVTNMSFQLERARALQQPAWVVNTLQYQFDELLRAYNASEPLTQPLPACTPATGGGAVWENRGGPVVYTKPIIFLIDEFSTSAGDIFPAMMQDNKRGPLVGKRSNGAGGSVSAWPLVLSEASASNTNSLVIRRGIVENAPDMPASRFIENTGVRPDIELERMTRENLMNGGQTFAHQFTSVLLDHIANSTR